MDVIRVRNEILDRNLWSGCVVGRYNSKRHGGATPRVAGTRLWTAGSARASNAELALDAAGSRCLPSPS